MHCTVKTHETQVITSTCVNITNNRPSDIFLYIFSMRFLSLLLFTTKSLKQTANKFTSSGNLIKWYFLKTWLVGFLLPVAVCFASVRVGFCVALCEREINDDGVRDVRRLHHRHLLLIADKHRPAACVWHWVNFTSGSTKARPINSPWHPLLDFSILSCCHRWKMYRCAQRKGFFTVRPAKANMSESIATNKCVKQ